MAEILPFVTLKIVGGCTCLTTQYLTVWRFATLNQVMTHYAALNNFHGQNINLIWNGNLLNPQSTLSQAGLQTNTVVYALRDPGLTFGDALNWTGPNQ